MFIFRLFARIIKNKFSVNKNFNLHYNINLSKKFISVLVLFALTIALSAQRVKEQAPPLRERLFFGGSFGLQFGSITDIQVSPLVGLWLLPRVTVATGPYFRYYKDYFSETTMYGLKGYTQFYFVKDLNSVIPLGIHTGLFLHLEDELLSLESAFWPQYMGEEDRFFLNSVLAGGGISQQIGRRSSINFMILWSLSNSIYDIYGNPELRVSFNF